MCVLEVDERRHANHDVLGYPGKNGLHIPRNVFGTAPAASTHQRMVSAHVQLDSCLPGCDAVDPLVRLLFDIFRSRIAHLLCFVLLLSP